VDADVKPQSYCYYYCTTIFHLSNNYKNNRYTTQNLAVRLCYNVVELDILCCSEYGSLAWRHAEREVKSTLVISLVHARHVMTDWYRCKGRKLNIARSKGGNVGEEDKVIYVRNGTFLLF